MPPPILLSACIHLNGCRTCQLVFLSDRIIRLLRAYLTISTLPHTRLPIDVRSLTDAVTRCECRPGIGQRTIPDSARCTRNANDRRTEKSQAKADIHLDSYPWGRRRGPGHVAGLDDGTGRSRQATAYPAAGTIVSISFPTKSATNASVS